MTDTTPQPRFQDIGDTTLQYLSYAGGEPTIVLLHATGFLPWLWHPIARRLAGRHRIIAPYFCDHRDTNLEKGGFDWLILAKDLADLCDRLNISRPILVGHSMGGTVTVFAQAVHGLVASGMILIEPIFFPSDYYRMGVGPEDHPLAAKSLKRRNHWNDAADVKAYLRTKALFANWEEEFLDLYIEYGTVDAPTTGLELTCAPPREAAIFMGGMSCDPWPMLSAIGCPVWVIEGADSGNRTLIDLPAAAARFPKGRYLAVPGAGHLIPMEKPAEILRIVTDFSRSLQPVSR